MKYNIWNKWDPLEVCMLGNNYAPEFFNGIPDKAGDPLKRICEETLEDLAGFKKILQEFGVEVIQPELDPKERFIDNPHRYPRGPLQPRDHQLILGNNAYSNKIDHPAIISQLEQYGPVENYFEDNSLPICTPGFYDIIAGGDYPSYADFCNNRKNKDFFLEFVWSELKDDFLKHCKFSGANSFMIGKKLFIAEFESLYKLSDQDSLFLQEAIPATKDFEVIIAPMDGHMDGNFHPIKPGAILTLVGVQDYEETFPGWDVCFLREAGWNQVGDWLDLKEKNDGKWWLAGEEDNDEFTHFVETWLQDWVGYVEETVFDVNVLMLDEHHCCVSNTNNEQVNAFFKKHNIEPVYVPWRHRYFWDGGLHCITLELKRRGEQKDYFN